jgi:hypothetical protein
MSKLMRRSVAALALMVTLCGSAAAGLTFEFLPKNPGWTAYGNGTRAPAGAVDSAGIVHLRGALLGRIVDSDNPFTMPLDLRPDKTIYVPVGLTNGLPGHLVIGTNGIVTLEAEYPAGQGPYAFLSLEGVTYARTTAPLHYKTVALINTWSRFANFTRVPAAAVDANNIVHLKGVG